MVFFSQVCVLVSPNLQSKPRAGQVGKSEVWLVSVLVTALEPGEGALVATCAKFLAT